MIADKNGDRTEHPSKTVGNTPLVRVRELGQNSEVHAKLEYYNRFGSVKDRPAWWMIREAERRGKLRRGCAIIIEPTSGNTGIALAGIAKQLGYTVEIAIPEAVSNETKEMLRALGAKVYETWDDLCPNVGAGTDQAISLARSLVKSSPHKYFMPNQYENFDNVRAHYETTGPEIWRQTNGRITHFVAGVGTGGTIAGVAKFLKEKNRRIKIYAVEPVPGHHIQGLRNLKESSTPKILERYSHLVDEWIPVSDKEAYETAQKLYDEEGLAVGPSSGAALYATLNSAENAKRGVYVTIFPDGRERHLSSFRNYRLKKGDPK